MVFLDNEISSVITSCYNVFIIISDKIIRVKKINSFDISELGFKKGIVFKFQVFQPMCGILD